MRTLLCTLATLALVACGSGKPVGGGGSGGSGGSGGTGGTGGNHAPPRVDRLQPDHGQAGDAVVLMGANFDPDAAGNDVRFGDLPAAVSSVELSGTQLHVVVPAGVVNAAVHVTSFGFSVDGPVFTVEARNPVPAIRSADPQVLAVGDTDRAVTLDGDGFMDATTAAIDGTSVQAALQPTGQLLVRVPDPLMAAAGTHSLVLHNPAPGGGDSRPYTLSVAPALRLLGASFAAADTLALQFDQDLDTDSASQGVHYSISPSLHATSGSIDPGIPRMVMLKTAASPADSTFTVTVDRSVRAASGVSLGAQNTATFRSFDALPDPLGTITPTADCSGAGIVDAAGLWAGDRILVTEKQGNQVQRLRLDGGLSGFYGSDGSTAGFHSTGSAAGCPGTDVVAEGALLAPVGAAIEDDDGTILVADTGHGALLAYPAAGGVNTLASSLTSPALMGAFGGAAYVAEPGHILRIDTSGGHEPLALGAPGTGDFQFAFATDAGGLPAISMSLASPGGNRIYLVADPGNHRIQQVENLARGAGWIGVGHESGFAPGGTCCSAGTDLGQFTDPRGVVALASGAFYAIDAAGGGRLQKFGPDGKPLRQVSLGFLPAGIAMASDGDLWIVESGGPLHRYVP